MQTLHEQIRENRYKAKQLQIKYVELVEGSYLSSPGVTGMPHSGGISDPTSDRACETAEIEQEIRVLNDEYNTLKSRIN